MHDLRQLQQQQQQQDLQEETGQTTTAISEEPQMVMAGSDDIASADDGYLNTAYLRDSADDEATTAAGSLDSNESFAQELQRYKLISRDGASKLADTTSDPAATEMSPLSGGSHEQQAATTVRGILKAHPPQAVAARSSRDNMTPETKLRLQRLLRQNAGVLRQDATSIMLEVYNIVPGQMTRKELDKRFSAVAMEMLREQEDRDLHPFGRGGRFEGVLYSRRVKVQVDHTKFLAWIVFATFILLTSGAIIFLAEMERRQKSQQQPTSMISAAAGTATTTSSLLLPAGNGTD